MTEKTERPARVQYARTYEELREIFKRNEIDIWAPMDVIDDRLDELAIECDTRIWYRGDDAEPIYWRHLVHTLRNEELDAKDRLATTPFFKVDDAETVDAHVLWPDTGLPWSMLPQPTVMTRGEFNSYVTNIKALRVEGHRGVQ